MDPRRDDLRSRALQDLRRFEVVMEGHFDYGNGYHGRLYLNPHVMTLRVPNVSLVEYPAPDNHPAAACPMCAQGLPVSAF